MIPIPGVDCDLTMDWDIDIFNFDGFDERELDLSIRSILLDESAGSTMLPSADQTVLASWPELLSTLPGDHQQQQPQQQQSSLSPSHHAASTYRKPSNCTTTVLMADQEDSDQDSGHASDEVSQAYSDTSLIEEIMFVGSPANEGGSDTENDARLACCAFEEEEETTDGKSLSEHTATQQTTNGDWWCEGCGQARNQNRRRCETCQRHRHRRSSVATVGHQPSASFSCSHCGKQFRRRLALTCHLRVHTGERPFRCEVCERSFSLRSTLAAHRKLHGRTDGGPTLQCETCGRIFTQPSALSSHRQLHAPVRPHCCGLCGKDFVRLHALKTHIRSHSNERPYGCEDCGKTFAEKHVLVRHRKTHSGERPHGCAVCGKYFKERYDLLRHSLIHSGQRPHQCTVCSKSFVQSNALAKHRKCHERNGGGVAAAAAAATGVRRPSELFTHAKSAKCC
ncbi:zinc finger protein 501-like [Anopheles albimanus]|nr:zinc finger protein 501-like [Anopheles albimanus]